jgi:hypothetical protein
MTVDIDCACGRTINVPYTVDASNTLHVDHDYLAAHIASHDDDDSTAQH